MARGSKAPAINTDSAYSRRKQLRSLQSRLTTMEKKLSSLHPELARTEQQLADADLYLSERRETLQATQKRHQQLRQEISDLEALWLARSEEFERLQEK